MINFLTKSNALPATQAEIKRGIQQKTSTIEVQLPNQLQKRYGVDKVSLPIWTLEDFDESYIRKFFADEDRMNSVDVFLKYHPGFSPETAIINSFMRD
jgi:hypothetical protein